VSINIGRVQEHSVVQVNQNTVSGISQIGRDISNTEESGDYDEEQIQLYESGEYETYDYKEYQDKKLAESQATIPDWQNFENVTKGQSCYAPFRFFTEKSHRPIIAISSFPGSGNTWARHLLHMASGYWTGNRRAAKPLKKAGWKAEDIHCKSRTTIAQKTHRLHHNTGKNVMRANSSSISIKKLL